MRARSLVLVVALLAGCAGGGDPPVATTPPTATPDPTPATPTPTGGPPTPTPTPASPTAPAPDPLPPRVLLNVSFDFSREGDATGRAPQTRESQAVPEGYATVIVNASLERASPAPTTLPVSGSLNQPTLHVFAPDGSEVALLDAEGETASLTLPAQEGKWVARFEGAGTNRGVVVVTALA